MSLERLIEESREDYYAALHRSSQHWHSEQHDLLPWLNYFLAIVRRASREFAVRAGTPHSLYKKSKSLISVEPHWGTVL